MCVLLRFSLVARTRTPFGTVCAGIGDGVCVGGLAGRVYVMAKGGLPCHPRTDVTYISRTVCVVLWRFGVLLFGTLAECSSFSFFQAGRVGHKRAPGFVRFCAVSLSTIFSSKRASVVVFVVGVPTDGRTDGGVCVLFFLFLSATKHNSASSSARQTCWTQSPALSRTAWRSSGCPATICPRR